MTVLTTLRRIHEVSSNDFAAGDYDKLLTAQNEALEVSVDCRAVCVDGGESDYFDITLPDGTVVDAISGYHLNGIHNFTDEE